MRHMDAQLCPMGALAFYLHIRFMVTKEYEKFNFSENSTWINQKLLCAMPPKSKQKRSAVEVDALNQLK